MGLQSLPVHFSFYHLARKAQDGYFCRNAHLFQDLMMVFYLHFSTLPKIRREIFSRNWNSVEQALWSLKRCQILCTVTTNAETVVKANELSWQ